MFEKPTTPEPDKPDYRTRPANGGDAEAFAKMYAQSWLDTYLNSGDENQDAAIKRFAAEITSPAQIEYGRQRLDLDQPDKMTLVAELADGEVVGLTRWEMKGPDKATLETLHVKKAFGGKGIAAKLMNDGLAWVGEGREVSLKVVKTNGHAIEFYKKFGFQIDDSDEEVLIHPTKELSIPVLLMKRRT